MENNYKILHGNMDIYSERIRMAYAFLTMKGITDANATFISGDDGTISMSASFSVSDHSLPSLEEFTSICSKFNGILSCRASIGDEEEDSIRMVVCPDELKDMPEFEEPILVVADSGVEEDEIQLFFTFLYEQFDKLSNP